MGVQPEGVEGAIADFVCFHCPLVASAEAKPSATIKSSSRCHQKLMPKRTKISVSRKMQLQLAAIAKKHEITSDMDKKLLTSVNHRYIIIMICRQKMSAGKKEKNHEEHETGSGVPCRRGDDAADGFGGREACVRRL